MSPSVCAEPSHHRDVRSVSTKLEAPRYGKRHVWQTDLTEAAPWRGSSLPVLSSTGLCSTEGATMVTLEARYGSAEEAAKVARQLAKDDQVQQAFVTYSSALDLDEDCAPLCDEFGQFLLSHGQLEGAEYLFNRALTLDPLNPEYCYRRGVVLQQRRQLGEAAEAFTTALRHDPKFIGALFNLGIVHRELGDHRSASNDFQRLLQLDPENHAARMLLGECLSELGDMDGAVRSLEEAVRLDPTNRQAQKDLAKLRDSAKVVDDGWG